MTDAMSGGCGPGCSCGAPSRAQFATIPVGAPTHTHGDGAGRHGIAQAEVPAQTFTMGDSSGDANLHDGELPRHPVTLAAFTIDATTVTNDAFARFVAATGYRTEAEQWGFSAVFHLAIAANSADVMGPAAGTPWWHGVRGADWRHPGGRLSGIDGRGGHPVVHVSWNDAQAYCAWASRRLPTEAEWECASRGGLAGAKYPWGDAEVDAGGWRANIWQGVFPARNTLDDGYLTTAPADTFAPNGYGLYQTVGNVWEWCADRFDARYYQASPAANPTGPAGGDGRVLRGGSYLCHISYCNRYRCSARSHNTSDSAMGNAGFRTVAC